MVTHKIFSLRWRMILLLTGIPLLILIPVLYAFGNRYTAAYRESYWDKAEIIANQIQYMMDDFQFNPVLAEDKQKVHEIFADFIHASALDSSQDFAFIALVDKNGYVVQHSEIDKVDTIDKRFTNLDTETVFQRTNQDDSLDSIWVTQRLFSTGGHYLVTRPVSLSSTDVAYHYLIIAEKANLVDPPMIPLLITAVVVVIIVILLMQIFLNRMILIPLRKLAEGSAIIGAGDLAYRIDVHRKDELGFVADAFNNMAVQVSELVTSLETTVKKRTRALEKRNIQLEAVYLVAQEAAQQHNATELLNTAVTTISDKFGFFHTAIFILDDEKTWAVLRSTSSDGGMRMLNRGHRLRVGEEGMVGNVALTGKPRIALDVGEDAVFFRNPDLQTTRSEMALPLISEQEVIGILDIQSEEPAAFTTEDISVLQLMANQLAVALSNVRVMETMQTTLVELRNLQTDFGRRGWAKLIQSDRPMAYEYDRADTTAVAPIPVPLDFTEGHVENRIVMDGETPVVIEALQAGERILGYLGLSDTNRVWTEDELSLVHSVGEQIALALDNAQLFEDSQKNERQQLLISQMLQTASNPDISPGQILPEIAAILAGGLDVGVAIGTLPTPDFPIVHPYTIVDPEGRPLPFFNNDIILDEEYAHVYMKLTNPEIVSIQPFVGQIEDGSVQEYVDTYDLDHVLCIPMMSGSSESRFIGLIPFRNSPSIDPDTQELAVNLANQIAVVMDNLNLSEETRQRSEELRLLYQSSLKLSELLEPADVLQSIAELGTQLLGADASNLWVYQSATDEIILTYDHQGGAEDRIGTRFHSGTGLVGQSIAQQKTLVVSDYATWNNRIEGLISSQFHAMLAIPLIGRFGPLGVLVCLSRQVAEFSDREISLADLFSAQAAAALENAQLNQEAQRRAQEFSSLYDAGIDLIAIHDVKELLAQSSEWAYRVLSANRAVLYLRESDTSPFMRGQSADDPRYLLDEVSDIETRDVLTGIIIRSKDSILIRDNRDHKALKTSALVGSGLLSLIGVPLQIGEEIIGAMFVYSSELSHFSERDLDLLEFLATQVSSALQNSFQFGQTEQALAVVGRQARYQSNVSQAVALLTERGTDAIQDVLQLLAEAADAPIALYYNSSDMGENPFWQLQSYWAAINISSERNADLLIQPLSISNMPKWLEMLEKQVSITARRDDLPEGARVLLQMYDYDMVMALAVQGAVDPPGFIALLRKGESLWENQEIVALQTSAAALSNTMARERLFEQVQQTLSETEALYRGGAALAESNTYQSILDVLLNHTVLGQGSADVTLQLFNSMWSESEIPEYAEVVAYWSSDQREHSRERFYVEDFPSSIEIIRKGVPTFIEDVAKDPVLDRRARAMFSKALDAESVVLVPLVVGGQRVGYLHATYPDKQAFTNQARRQLASLAQQAAIAVLNMQQLRATEARVRREQLIRQITGRIQEAPDVEGVLQTTIRELGRAFGTSRNKIQFQLPKQGTEDSAVAQE